MESIWGLKPQSAAIQATSATLKLQRSSGSRATRTATRPCRERPAAEARPPEAQLVVPAKADVRILRLRPPPLPRCPTRRRPRHRKTPTLGASLRVSAPEEPAAAARSRRPSRPPKGRNRRRGGLPRAGGRAAEATPTARPKRARGERRRSDGRYAGRARRRGGGAPHRSRRT